MKTKMGLDQLKLQPLLILGWISLWISMGSLGFFSPDLRAAGPSHSDGGGSEEGDRKDKEGGKPNVAEDEDYTSTPFTEYGEFNEAEEEDENSRFYQFGRFFGVSAGLGNQLVGGNRGALWQGGFPMFDFKVHYWFDFNFALDLGFYTASHYFNTTVQNLGHVDVSMVRVGVDIKYYFPTKNLSAPITFANPYLAAGGGAYTKTQNSNSQQTQDQDTSVGICLGGGLEFTLSPRKTFFQLEGKVHLVNFRDTFTTIYQGIGMNDMTGPFYTVTSNILFTW